MGGEIEITKDLLLQLVDAMILGLDVNGRIIYVNDAGCKILESPREALIGLNWFEHFIEADERQKVHHYFLQIMDQQVPFIDYFSNSILTPSNKRHLIQWHNIPLFDKNGTIAGTISSGVDITEAATMARQFDENKARFQAMVENINDWVWEVDAQGCYTYVSPKAKDLMGYEPDELLGKTPFDLMPFEEAKRVGEIFGRIIQDHAPFERLENINLHKDGHEVILETSGAPIFDEEGNLRGYRGIDRDVTETKKLQKELDERNRMMLTQSKHAAMGEMISMIAHQWRQPIATVGMIANNILLEIELGRVDMEKVAQFMERINDQVGYLSKTINDFRDFFRPRDVKEEVSLEQLIEETLNLAGDSLKNNGITVTCHNDGEITLTTYSQQLKQVLLNLLNNAKDAIIAHRKEGGRITIALYREGTSVYVTVEDNGGGIDANVLETIADPYVSSKGINGTGLGLYMSKVIVEKNLGGSLNWTNNGVGASFMVELPTG